MFTGEEQQAILAIPLSATINKDVLCWTGTEKGNYSVKSGYHMEMQRTEVVNDGGVGSTPEETVCWKKIWKLNIPGKLKVFIWKISHNILPVGVKVCKRVSQVGDECPNCGLQETIKHYFVECNWAASIWRRSPVAYLFQLAEDVPCNVWIKKALNSGDDSNLNMFDALNYWCIVSCIRRHFECLFCPFRCNMCEFHMFYSRWVLWTALCCFPRFWCISESVEQLEFKLGIRRRDRSSFGTIWEAVHLLEHNFSLGSPNDARLVALESYRNSIQLS
ncbi:hypothetical protein LINGRAHAP2_LOCUS8012 [Linum grandiflorum]